jgi:two-component system, NtrC family, sensor kinase
LKLNATRLGVRDAAAHVSDSHEEAFTLLTQARESVRKANQHVHTHVRISLDVLLITLGSTALLLALALRQAQVNIVHPLRALSKGADRLGRGELRHRIDLDRLDEIGSLATAFNSMADQLADAHTNLEKRVRKRTQDFIRAARLADLGVLASGIAHELNTPLASIASSAEGLQRRANSKQLTPELMADYTQVITTETARAREITTRMLGLVRQDPGEIARVPLALIAKQAVAALNHRAEGKQVSLASAHVDEGVHVLANAGELVQVIVNLLANAIDASPPTSIVEISTWVEGSRLFLEVSDRGDGIPEEKIDSIFDPFYTTKSPGEGTGLGLALVATMVEFRGGTISVHSHLGSGTVFQVDLPAVWSQPR